MCCFFLFRSFYEMSLIVLSYNNSQKLMHRPEDFISKRPLRVGENWSLCRLEITRDLPIPERRSLEGTNQRCVTISCTTTEYSVSCILPTIVHLLRLLHLNTAAKLLVISIRPPMSPHTIPEAGSPRTLPCRRGFLLMSHPRKISYIQPANVTSRVLSFLTLPGKGGVGYR
jgi:hypothetical protein